MQGCTGRPASATCTRVTWAVPREDATSGDALEHRGQALTPADAHRLEAVTDLATGHLPRERGEDPATGGAHRVAERDARAVDVEPIEVLPRELPLTGDRQHLSGERLVQLDQVHVGQRELRRIHCL